LKLANILVNFPEYPYDLIGAPKGMDPNLKQLQVKDLIKNIDMCVPGRLQIKIADLGFAKELMYDEMAETICGTPLVMAPEVLNGNKYNHKADVWSMGVVFFEMLVGFTPFTGRDKTDLKKNLLIGDYGLPRELRLSLQGLDFLNSCLQFESSQRLSWNDLVQHPYIKDSPFEEQRR
jgi:serine/threonine protein kinase